MPQHTSPHAPRQENDCILLGKSTVLARRFAVQGCWEIEQPSPPALSALLSLAYGKAIQQDAPIFKAIREATAMLPRNPLQSARLLSGLPEPLAGCDDTLSKAQDLLERGVKPFALAKALRRAHLGLSPAPAFSASLRLTDRGVVLGKSTVIAALEDHPGGRTGLAIAGHEPRILTLLSIARRGLVEEEKALACLGTASRALQKGDTALAAIALSHLGQPRLEDERLAKRLSIASIKLRGGMPPGDLLKACGLSVRRGEMQPEWLRKYDPKHYPHIQQPPSHQLRKDNDNHFPAGTPDSKGGEFAPKDGGDPASMSPEAKKAELDKLSDAHDKALLAQHTYGEGTPLPPGYRQVTDPDELAKLGISQDDLSPYKSSMHAELFVKDGQYVLAFRGTRLTETQDAVNNVEQGIGLESEAYDKAEDLARKLASRTNGNLSFTGHSLGGGLASAAAVVTGQAATTFNAAGIDLASIQNKSPTAPKVDAYYVGGEPLSTLQDNRGIGIPIAREGLSVYTGYEVGQKVREEVGNLPYVPKVVGDAVGAVAGLGTYLITEAAAESVTLVQEVRGHQVLPPAYGTRHQLPASVPSGETDNMVNRHEMGWCIGGIEARQKQLLDH